MKKTWTELKSLISLKGLSIQYIEETAIYYIWARDDRDKYYTIIDKADIIETGSDEEDFVNNYKVSANKSVHPTDTDGKPFTRAESRPLDKTTYFTCIGDSANNIGDGQTLRWDFENTDNDITAPTDCKKKRVEFKFLDPLNIKEGAIYFQDAKKGSYLHLHVVCPAGGYYLDNNKNPALAQEDTIVETFVNHHFIYGNCTIGDELNTEASSSEIPVGYKFWLDVTVPDTDIDSFGHVSLEIYRPRTRIL